MNDKAIHATPDNPCPHCGKPDWCYRIGVLSVCNRDIEPGPGWRATSKKDGGGHYFYAPIEEKKPIRPYQKRIWEYPDREGNPLIRVIRIDDGSGKKKIWQEKWQKGSWSTGIRGINRADIPIYRFAEVRSAISRGEPIFIVEGETCADALWDLGLPATTNLAGTGKWRPSDTVDMEGAKVVFCPDRDVPGLKHMDEISKDFPESPWVYAFPDSPGWRQIADSQGVDVADWIRDHRLGAQDIISRIEKKRNIDTKKKKTQDSSAPREEDFDDICTQIRKILEISCPGKRKWALGKLAKKNKTSINFLMNCYDSARENLPKFETIGIQELLATTPDRFEWLVAGLLPVGTTALLYAEAGTGKTLFANSLIKSVAGGHPWNGYPTKKGKVLYIQTDEPKINTAHNLKAAGFADLPQENLSVVFDWQFDQILLLKEEIEKQRPKLIVLDSLTSSNRTAGVEEKSVEYARNLYELRDLAMQYDCAILVLHHENKVGGVRGSTAIKANVSEVWHLKKTRELSAEHRLLEVEKSRAGCIGIRQLLLDPADLSWEDQGDFDPRNPDGDAGSKRAPLGARLLSFLQERPGVPFEPLELQGEFGSKNSIRVALSKLFKNGLIEREYRERKSSQGKNVKYYVYYFAELISSPEPQAEQGIEEVITVQINKDHHSEADQGDLFADQHPNPAQGEDSGGTDQIDPPGEEEILRMKEERTVAGRYPNQENYHWHGQITDFDEDCALVIWDELDEDTHFHPISELRLIQENNEDYFGRIRELAKKRIGRYKNGSIFGR